MQLYNTILSRSFLPVNYKQGDKIEVKIWMLGTPTIRQFIWANHIILGTLVRMICLLAASFENNVTQGIAYSRIKKGIRNLHEFSKNHLLKWAKEAEHPNLNEIEKLLSDDEFWNVNKWSSDDSLSN